MRIHINFSPSKETVPFNYQPVLTGALHKWIGKNDVHDDVSLYSFSWLQKASASKHGLHFNDDGSFFVSSYDNNLLQKIISGIQADPVIGFGLIVRQVAFEKEPNLQNGTFFCASPIFVKRWVGEREVHYTYQDPEADQFLTDTLKTKLRKANLEDNDVRVSFDRNYSAPKTKVIYYNDIGSRVSICPVKITGTYEQLAFAWNVGIGNSTGIGFGALK